MTVIELSSPLSGSNSDDDKPDLLVHSPVFLDAPLKDAIDRLGTVRHIISPNYEHVKYAKMWGEAYSNVFMWGCPEIMEREPDVCWSGEIPYGCRPPTYRGLNESSNAGVYNLPKEMWDWSEVQPLHVDVEVNPFTGRPFFNEVVFFHSKSKTLLTTDTYCNYLGDGITNSNYDSLKNPLDFKNSNALNNENYDAWELATTVEVPFTSR